MDYMGLDPHEFAGDHDEVRPEPEEWLHGDTVMVPVEPEPYDWERDAGERPRPTGLMLNIAECEVALAALDIVGDIEGEQGASQRRALKRRLRLVIGE
jgi:hypothetical protein